MNAAQPELLIGSLREIEASTRRMRLWIDELVDVARLQVGQELRLNHAPTGLVALARQAAAEFEGTTERHRLRVEATEAELVGEWMLSASSGCWPIWSATPSSTARTEET